MNILLRPAIAGVIAVLVLSGGCAEEFAVDVTVARGELPLPAGLSIVVMSILPSSPALVGGLVVRREELSEAADETFRAVVVPHPDAELVRISVSGFDAKANVFEEGIVELVPSPGVLATVVPLALVSSCGNGVREASEECDGIDFGENGFDSCEARGFGGGTLTCSLSCTAEETGCTTSANVCGDGLAAGVEQCDGGDFRGRDCSVFGCVGGELGCTATCEADLSACTGC